MMVVHASFEKLYMIRFLWYANCDAIRRYEMIPIMMPVPMYMGGGFGALSIIHIMIIIIILGILIYMILEIFDINKKIIYGCKKIKHKMDYMIRYKERKKSENIANEIVEQSKRLNKK